MLTKLIETEADHCVKCGLCLPHCPTYGKTRNEADSPRGRIALLQGLTRGRLQDSPVLRRHLEGCLHCRACERVCPSRVRYGLLLDAGRAVLARQEGSVPAPRPWDPIWDRIPLAPRRTAALLRLLRYSGLLALARGLGLPRRLGLARAFRYLPAVPRRRLWRRHYPARGPERGTVALFTGCAGWVFEQDALAAAMKLLNACGYVVLIPPAQACCGALHLHRGDLPQALALARRNAACFNALDADAVVHLATGCGATLSEYGQLQRLESGPGAALRLPVVEICRFLAAQEWPEAAFSPLPAEVWIHEPCSQRYVLRDPEAPRELLARIPQVALRELPDNHLCCGGAGEYPLRQPELADALLADKTAILRRHRPRWLVTSNSGCRLQLQRGIREAQLPTRVLHPVELLVRQLTAR